MSMLKALLVLKSLLKKLDMNPPIYLIQIWIIINCVGLYNHQLQMFKSLIVLLLVSAIIINIHSKPIDPTKVVIALNCGSKEQVVNSAQNNFKYMPDSQYVKGASVDVDYQANTEAVEAEIKFTFQKEVYMYQRHTYQQMTYQLPVKKGPHTLILKFAQMYFRSPGQRVFNIKIGDTIVLQNFDVIQKSGSRYSAHQQYLPIDVRKDGVYYNGAKINNALTNGKLRLSFAKGKSDNPIVQGIIVYADSIQNSPKHQFQTMKSKWNSQQEMLKAKKQQAHLKQLIAVQKKKERTTIRNDQLLVEDVQSKNQSNSSQTAEKYGLIRKVLMGPIGIIAWALFFGYKFYFIYKNIFKMQAQKVKSG